ncbi:unnamed protein product [Urochloa decumbens]|uniref:Uncharacterized protein n=1 Tax=Urochloa decumbens TaxID=240449 RepID=A0ABC9B4L2_9POAL
MDHRHRFAIVQFLLLAAAAVSSLSADSSADTPPIALCWGSSYSRGSSYQANLDALVNRLASGAASAGGFFNDSLGSNSTPDDAAAVVYGAAMCYADSRWVDCLLCLEGAASSAFAECPYSRNAAIMYRDCLLRYSEQPFSSKETERGHVLSLWVADFVDDVASWNGTRWKLMNRLVQEAAASPQRLANGSEPYGKDSTNMVYGMVQCRNDLTAQGCTGCLTYHLLYLLADFPNNVNTYANVRGFSCMAKHDRYPIALMAPPGAPPALPNPSSKTLKVPLIIGLATAACGIVLVLVSLFLYWRQRTMACGGSNEGGDMEGELIRNGAGPKRFGLDVLVAATGNFSDDKKLGEGGFGSVYRGFLDELDLDVAIKRVSRSSMQGRKEYASEVNIISGLRHRNLVKLIGWCHNHDELLLVYELMPNRSLDKHLYSADNILSWQLRYRIILGIGSALLYLHEECEQGVLHRDIKPSNVMLDATFNAKLGDFGLARLVNHSRGIHTTELAGTLGYMDPACLITGKFSIESDIYSFGVVLLEVACGRQPVVVVLDNTTHLVRRVSELYRRGVILDAADPRLGRDFDELEMDCVLVVGLWCTQHDQTLRPSIRQAISALRFEAPLPTVIDYICNN